jgi:hypothetical protein
LCRGAHLPLTPVLNTFYSGTVLISSIKKAVNTKSLVRKRTAGGVNSSVSRGTLSK